MEQYQFTLVGNPTISKGVIRDPDDTHVDFEFSVVSTEKIETPREVQFTRRVRVRVTLSGSLCACAPWKPLLHQRVEEFSRHVFAFAQERLTEAGYSLKDNPYQTFSLDEYTEEGRFAQGPLYTLANVHPEEPFLVPAKSSRLGFTPPA